MTTITDSFSSVEDLRHYEGSIKAMDSVVRLFPSFRRQVEDVRLRVDKKILSGDIIGGFSDLDSSLWRLSIDATKYYRENLYRRR